MSRTSFLGRVREATSITAQPGLARGGSGGADGVDDEVDVVDCPDCEDGLNSDGTVCDTCDGNGFVDSVREAELTAAARKRIPKSDFAVPSKAPGSGSYPIHDREHAINALARASGKPEESTVKAAVYAKYPDLKPGGTTKESAVIAAMGEEIRRMREGMDLPLGELDTGLRTVKTTDGREGYAVTLIREGPGNKADNRWYARDAIKELVESGRANGMQAYANHPPLDQEETLPERSVKDIVGTYADVTFAEADGRAQAEAVLVPVAGPGFEWMQTLAEAAASHPGPKPLCGISLYGGCAGEYGERPDGSVGETATRIYPTSADVVTNAGAGGEFHRQLMESARQRRALRESTRPQEKPMTLEELKAKQRDVATRMREADTPEKQAAVAAELEELAGAEVEAPAAAEGSLETLAESQPQLVASLREAARQEISGEKAELEAKLREHQRLEGETAATMDTLVVLKECDVTSVEDVQWFVAEVQHRGLREADAIKTFVKGQLDRDKRVREGMLEALNGGGVEGVPGSRPANAGAGDGGVAKLREAGIPIKEPVAA